MLDKTLAPERVDDAGRSTRLGRLGPLLWLVHLGWALPSAAGGTLLQALIADQRGTGKVGSFAVIITIGAVVAVVSTVVAGALSDRTRSRFGRRNPWILGGAVVASAGLALTGVTTSFPLQVLAFAAYQGGLNAMLAAVSALLPDRVATSALGRASALAGFGYLVGTALGGFAASAAIQVPARGLLIVPWTMLVAALLMFFLIQARSSREQTRAPQSLRDLLPPRDRDFLLAFAGRFCVILALYVVVFYQLYVLTDFLKVDVSHAGQVIALGTLMLGVAAMAATLAGGLLSDRLGRRKVLVIAASLLVALGAAPVAIAPSVPALLTFCAVAGFGYGGYLAVDQALMVEVLPDSGAEAKQLGMLSVANTLPQVLGPAVAAVVVTQLGYRALYVFSIVVAILGAVFVALIRRVR
jgi:MFS family permease